MSLDDLIEIWQLLAQHADCEEPEKTKKIDIWDAIVAASRS